MTVNLEGGGLLPCGSRHRLLDFTFLFLSNLAKIWDSSSGFNIRYGILSPFYQLMLPPDRYRAYLPLLYTHTWTPYPSVLPLIYDRPLPRHSRCPLYVFRNLLLITIGRVSEFELEDIGH